MRTRIPIIRKYWSVFFLLVIWLIFSAPYFFKGLVPFPSKYLATFFAPWSAYYGMPVKNSAMPDIITQIYPWKMHTVNILKTGQIPLWNPYGFSGTPHAANYQSAVFSPINVLYFILPFNDAWSLGILLQPILAGLFMYAFLRSLGRSNFASIIGSVSWMFCGFITTWMAYGTLAYAILFFPLVCYGIQKYFSDRRTVWMLIIVFSVGFSLVSGHFQTSIYLLIGSAVFLIHKILETRNGKLGMLVSLSIVLGILLSAPQILLTYDAYVTSVRSSNFTKGEVIPWKYAITTFAPDFFGNPVTRNDWFGHYAEWNSYSGTSVLILALVGLVITGMTRKLVPFIILAVGSYLLSHDGPFVDLLFFLKIPVLSTSSASRIIVLWSFATAALSANGFDAVWNADKKQTKKIAIFSFGIVVILILFWGILLLGRPFKDEYLTIAQRNFAIPSVIALISLAGTVLIVQRNKLHIRMLSSVMIIGLVVFEMLRFASKWMPFEPKQYMYPDTRVITYLKNTAGYDRVFGNIGNEAAMPNGLHLIEGYDAMYRARYGKFISAFSDGIPNEGERSVVVFDKHGKYAPLAFRILGVRYFIMRKSDKFSSWVYPVWDTPQDFKMVYEDDQFEVYEYVKSLPRVFLVDSYIIADSENSAFGTMVSEQFNPRTTVVLEKRPDIEPKAGNGDAYIRSYESGKVVIVTSSEVPKILYFSDPFDTGWTVTVDSIKRDILRANYDLRSVALSKGTHEVVFSYTPTGLQYGVWISITSLIVLIGLSIYNKYQTMKR